MRRFLSAQVAQRLLSEHPSIATLVTLSPLPDFADWIQVGCGNKLRNKLSGGWNKLVVVGTSLKPRMVVGNTLTERCCNCGRLGRAGAADRPRWCAGNKLQNAAAAAAAMAALALLTDPPD